MYNSVLCYLNKTVERYPDKAAVVDKIGEITFIELKNYAQHIAHIIKTYHVNEHSPILVYLPKSRWSIAAFMGVLYSGNFYTPTDVNFPFEKVKGILECLNPVLIISDTRNKEKLVKNGIDDNIVINIDDIDYEEMITEISIDNIIDTDIAYTLFTSGSTGVPKGVAVTNRSIIDYIDWAISVYAFNSEDRIGNQAPFYFDNSTLDIYSCISTAATLYIIPETFFAFPAKLMQYVQDNELTTVFWVPSVLISVANADILTRIRCTTLNKILFAGEVMPNKHLNYWRQHIPDALYSNLYGPTEITVDCTYYIVDREFDDDEPLPIGIPCRNSEVMLLSEDNQRITNYNETGEICVRGSSLAMGYYGNPEKTSEVFVQNPLNDRYRELIYRTGDLGYYNEYNEIMFVGRKDFQIKHMGYRIELGEIEQAALKIDCIGNVCALYDTNNKEIILCYELKSDMDEKDIRKQMIGIIPKYMVPTKYYNVEKFPYTDNGKIDRKELGKLYLK